MKAPLRHSWLPRVNKQFLVCPRLWLPFFAASFLLFVTTTVAEEPVEKEHPFRFGFSLALMPDVNENDARAAMKTDASRINVRYDRLIGEDPTVATSMHVL